MLRLKAFPTEVLPAIEATFIDRTGKKYNHLTPKYLNGEWVVGTMVKSCRHCGVYLKMCS
jgi:hypothetical protein